MFANLRFSFYTYCLCIVGGSLRIANFIASDCFTVTAEHKAWNLEQAVVQTSIKQIVLPLSAASQLENLLFLTIIEARKLSYIISELAERTNSSVKRWFNYEPNYSSD